MQSLIGDPVYIFRRRTAHKDATKLVNRAGYVSFFTPGNKSLKSVLTQELRREIPYQSAASFSDFRLSQTNTSNSSKTGILLLADPYCRITVSNCGHILKHNVIGPST